jgi:hypothetical protein
MSTPPSIPTHVEADDVGDKAKAMITMTPPQDNPKVSEK